jgi:hypothetical protein
MGTTKGGEQIRHLPPHSKICGEKEKKKERRKYGKREKKEKKNQTEEHNEIYQ